MIDFRRIQKKLSVVLCITSIFSLSEAAESNFKWRIPLGLTHASYFSEINDATQRKLEEETYGYVESTESLPIALFCAPYVEHMPTGLGFGAEIGPLSMVLGDGSYTNLPLGLNARYYPLRGNTSPYLKLGLRKNMVSGDVIEGDSIGFCGAVGVEFNRQGAVGYGLEVGIDKSEIEITHGDNWESGQENDILDGGVTFSLFVVF
ncbi:MAG: hypothetical protein HQL32_11340 [Planctomycetes bacterium]|nr:hypothetical protein [Planctomycetota bacterium]